MASAGSLYVCPSCQATWGPEGAPTICPQCGTAGRVVVFEPDPAPARAALRQAISDVLDNEQCSCYQNGGPCARCKLAYNELEKQSGELDTLLGSAGPQQAETKEEEATRVDGPTAMRGPRATAASNETKDATVTPNQVSLLADRAAWYRDGCDGLEDRDGYYASGDCARDAASDLEAALSEIRVLESVIVKLRTKS